VVAEVLGVGVMWVLGRPLLLNLTAWGWFSLLAGCGAAGPWANHAGTGWRWPREPTVGASTPELRQLTAAAVEAWGYGRYRPDCRGADVCVVLGARGAHAGPRGSRCIAVLSGVTAADPIAVQHELGHCYGLGHSRDPTSVMCSSSDQQLKVQVCERGGVTDADRRLLRAQ